MPVAFETLALLAAGQTIAVYLSWAWLLAVVIVGFGLLIFVHELGHFLAAKKVGIRVDTFSVGFGPRLFGVKHRGTDYCVRALPLGGYVKMHGQEDFALDDSAQRIHDPDSFHGKTVGQRFFVVSAGPIMNLLFAMLLFALVYIIGKQVLQPVVGHVIPGTPAETAGMKVGDRIIKVNGKQTGDFSDVQQEIWLASQRYKIQITVQRPGVDHPVDLTPVETMRDPNFGMQQIGISPGRTLKVLDDGGEFGDDPAAPQFKKHDLIIAVNGRAIDHFHQLEETLNAARGAWCTVDVKRWPLDDEGEPRMDQEPTVVSGIRTRSVYYFVDPRMRTDAARQGPPADQVLGIVARCRVVSDNSPEREKAGQGRWPQLRTGDVVLEIAGIENPPLEKVWAEIDRRKGEKVMVKVLRHNTEVIETQLDLSAAGIAEDAPIMAPWLPEDGLVVAADVLPDSPAQEAGLVPGSRVLQLGEKPISDWYSFFAALETYAGQAVPIKFTVDGQPREQTMRIPPLGQRWGDKPAWNERLRFHYFRSRAEYLTELKQTWNPALALAWGVKDGWTFAIRNFRTLKSMAAGSVSTRNVSGPVGIVHTGLQFAQLGLPHLIWFLGVISVSLAGLNVLPIPIMDGGLLVFLLVEKIKGSPVHWKVQVATQLIGLVVIVSLFLAVTCVDVSKLFSGSGL